MDLAPCARQRHDHRESAACVMAARGATSSMAEAVAVAKHTWLRDQASFSEKLACAEEYDNAVLPS
jgi:hypothetical protein